MANKIQKIAPPALPWATENYERVAEDEYSNILRIFFNRLTNAFNALLDPQGGQYLDNPNGLFFCIENQTLAATNTATEICFKETYLSNGVIKTDDTEITCVVPGIYNFQFSGQLESTNSSAKNVYVWIQRDGVDIGYSTHAYTVSGVNAQFEISWNFNIDMQPEQTLKLIWAADNTNVQLTSTAATTPHPGIPAAVLAVSFVSALPAELPTPP